MYGNRSLVYSTLWAARRALGRSPMQKLFRALRARGVRPAELDVLELFGADGARHSMDYASRVRSLEIWELNEAYLPGLERNLPHATIRIGDAFQLVDSTDKTFNLAIADEPGHIYGQQGEHCEHFDLLEDHLFRVLRPESLLILNLVPEPRLQLAGLDSWPTCALHMARRARFYQTGHPDRLEIAEMLPAYHRVAEANGFRIEWHQTLRRTARSNVHYLALKLRRQP